LQQFRVDIPANVPLIGRFALVEGKLSIKAKRKYENKRSRNRKFSKCAYWLLPIVTIYLEYIQFQFRLNAI